jgi:hypothetical protein
MHPMVLEGEVPPGLFDISHCWGGPAGIVLGDLVYGCTTGLLYTQAGRISGAVPCLRSCSPPGSSASNPTVEGGRWRLDELEQGNPAQPTQPISGAYRPVA